MVSYRNISCLELSALVESGVALVDIRRQDEWQRTGVVAGSLLLTFFDQAGNADPVAWRKQLDQQLPADQPMALICRSGYRTELVCEFLCQTSNRTEIYNVADGILGWMSAGLPVKAI